MTPLFSIITVCYNSADELERTIASIDSQTFGLYEHVIIDGASNDRTPAVLESAKKDKRTIVSEPDNGIYDAMNKGLGRAKGEYVIFMNAGDRFHENETLQYYADTIAANDSPGMVYGQTILVDAASERAGKPDSEELRVGDACMPSGHGCAEAHCPTLQYPLPFFGRFRLEHTVSATFATQCVYRPRGMRLSERGRDYGQPPEVADRALAHNVFLLRHYAHAMASCRFRRTQSAPPVQKTLNKPEDDTI